MRVSNYMRSLKYCMRLVATFKRSTSFFSRIYRQKDYAAPAMSRLDYHQFLSSGLRCVELSFYNADCTLQTVSDTISIE